MSGDRELVTGSGLPGERAFAAGDIIVCPECGEPIASLRVPKRYFDRLVAADLAFFGRPLRDGDPALCPDCGTDWLARLTVAPRVS